MYLFPYKSYFPEGISQCFFLLSFTLRLFQYRYCLIFLFNRTLCNRFKRDISVLCIENKVRLLLRPIGISRQVLDVKSNKEKKNENDSDIFKTRCIVNSDIFKTRCKINKYTVKKFGATLHYDMVSHWLPHWHGATLKHVRVFSLCDIGSWCSVAKISYCS